MCFFGPYSCGEENKHRKKTGGNPNPRRSFFMYFVVWCDVNVLYFGVHCPSSGATMRVVWFINILL